MNLSVINIFHISVRDMKEQFTKKRNFCHHFLTLVSFQTRKVLIHLQNTN